MSTTVEIVGPNLLDQSRGTFEVHTPTCQARYRNVLGGADMEGGWLIEVTQPTDIAEDVYTDHAGDEGLAPGTPEFDQYMQDVMHDFHICHCAAKIIKSNPTNQGASTMSKNKYTTCQCLTITHEDEHMVFAGTCGGTTRATFAPGHDARTKGTLQKAFRTGRQINMDGQQYTAEELAKVYGYERFLVAAPVRKRSTKKSNDPIMVKLGRWTYEAAAVDEVEDGFEVTYLDKKGEVTRKTVKSDPRI